MKKGGSFRFHIGMLALGKFNTETYSNNNNHIVHSIIIIDISAQFQFILIQKYFSGRRRQYHVIFIFYMLY